MSDIRVGLVLSGGGAKGAYQAGVVRALAESGAQVEAVAGASIGALNGAVIASAPSLQDGAEHLGEIWRTLGESSPLSPRMPTYLELLAASGLALNGLSFIRQLAGLAGRLSGGPWTAALLPIVDRLESGLFCDAPLHRLLDQYLDSDKLANGLPLYVSVFKRNAALVDVLACLGSELGLAENADSEFLHVQSLPQSEQRQALLASTAIPMLFAPKQVNQTDYSDGGQGGWSKGQGNTPIAPLLRAGYKTVIVSHLSDGSLWSRQDFPEATILEIRPQSEISRSGGASDLLGFDSSKIQSWIQQGYEDARHCLDQAMKAAGARTEWRTSEAALSASEKPLDELDRDLAAAMERLR
jgi:NTE family protein